MSRDRWRVPVGISLGAIAGALSRYYIAIAINQTLGPSLVPLLGSPFPLGTMVVNLSGAFGLGFCATWTLRQTGLSIELEKTIIVGFFGAYTTFSTYELNAETLLANHAWILVAAYWGGSAIFGVLCLEAGRFLANRLMPN